MSTAQIALDFLLDDHMVWGADWIWGCPLIVLTVIMHVLCIGYINQKAILIHGRMIRRRYGTAAFGLVVGTTALLATLLHGIETAIWALAYIFIGALPDPRSSMLYSLGAMTTYGHETLYLEERWRLMGTLEALNGWLLFGLSTAFLFFLIQEVSPHHRTGRQGAADPDQRESLPKLSDLSPK
jgi:hypothetical protein